MTLYEFTCQAYRDKRKDGEKIIDQGFMEGHPLRDTHVLRRRSHEVVPILYGKKLKAITNDSTTEEKERNSIIALALLDLKGTHLTWHEAFTNWNPTPEIKQLLFNAYDLDYARKRAGEFARENNIENRYERQEKDSDDEDDDKIVENVNDDDGFIPPEDFNFDDNNYMSDYSKIDKEKFESNKANPVRFPISSMSSERTQHSVDIILENLN